MMTLRHTLFHDDEPKDGASNGACLVCVRACVDALRRVFLRFLCLYKKSGRHDVRLTFLHRPDFLKSQADMQKVRPTCCFVQANACPPDFFTSA
jgi:hypothetical protein